MSAFLIENHDALDDNIKQSGMIIGDIITYASYAFEDIRAFVNPFNCEWKDADGNTPMHLGALNGFGAVVKLLFSMGANDDIKNLASLTPLDCAKAKKHDILVEQWEDLKAEGIAARKCIQFEYLAEFTKQKGESESMRESREKRERSIISCIETEKNPNRKGSRLTQKTRSRLAKSFLEKREEEKKEICEKIDKMKGKYDAMEDNIRKSGIILKDIITIDVSNPSGMLSDFVNPFNCEWKDADGNTPMHLGALNGFGAVVKLLFSMGANDDIKNLASLTPLDCAKAKKHDILVEQWEELKAEGIAAKRKIQFEYLEKVGRQKGESESMRESREKHEKIILNFRELKIPEDEKCRDEYLKIREDIRVEYVKKFFDKREKEKREIYEKIEKIKEAKKLKKHTCTSFMKFYLDMWLTYVSQIITSFEPMLKSLVDNNARLQPFLDLTDSFFSDSDIDGIDKDGNTLMHLVVNSKDLENIFGVGIILEHLFSKGAKDSIINCAGQTPLDCAKANKNDILVEQWNDIKRKGVIKKREIEKINQALTGVRNRNFDYNNAYVTFESSIRDLFEK